MSESRLRVLLLAGLAISIAAVVIVFMIPLADCPNCSRPPELWDLGTSGVTVQGRLVATGCWGCSGRPVTLWHKWTWPAPRGRR